MDGEYKCSSNKVLRWGLDATPWNGKKAGKFLIYYKLSIEVLVDNKISDYFEEEVLIEDITNSSGGIDKVLAHQTISPILKVKCKC